MILVDPRAGSGPLLNKLKRRVNCPVVSFTLESGDIAFEGRGPDDSVVMVGIEHKQLGDVLGCLRTDRFAGFQLKGMNRDYNMVYLLVEGLWRPGTDGMLETYVRGKGFKPLVLGNREQIRRGKGQTFTYAELDKHLASLEIQKNVILIRSGSQIEALSQIVDRYQWWQKDWDEHVSAEAIKFQANITFQKITWLRKIACELPGIGWKKSRAVDEYFVTIERMVNALPTEWRQVEGIGERLSVKLYGLMRGKE